MKKFIHIFFLLGFAPLVFADHDEKGSKDLPKGRSSALVDVIIQFKLTSPKSGNNKELQDHLDEIQQLLKKYGVQAPQNNQQQGQNGQQHGQHEDTVLNSIKAIHLKVPTFFIPILKANPYVKYVSPNRPTAKFLDVSTASVNANLAWQYG